MPPEPIAEGPPPFTECTLEDLYEPYGPADEAAFGAALELFAEQAASQQVGLESGWTSSLAEKLTGLCASCERLDDVLRGHGWTGTQFSRRPDVEKVAEAIRAAQEAARAARSPSVAAGVAHGGHVRADAEDEVLHQARCHCLLLCAAVVASIAQRETQSTRATGLIFSMLCATAGMVFLGMVPAPGVVAQPKASEVGLTMLLVPFAAAAVQEAVASADVPHLQVLFLHNIAVWLGFRPLIRHWAGYLFDLPSFLVAGIGVVKVVGAGSVAWNSCGAKLAIEGLLPACVLVPAIQLYLGHLRRRAERRSWQSSPSPSTFERPVTIGRPFDSGAGHELT